ncbi:MAG: hypothetical protein ACE1ZZ_01090, partial [Dehalococcoidia bacterium]
PECRTLTTLVVDELRVLSVDLVLPAAGRVLQLEDRFRVEQVILAISTPLIFSPTVELVVFATSSWERAGMTPNDFFRDGFDSDTADT